MSALSDTLKALADEVGEMAHSANIESYYLHKLIEVTRAQQIIIEAQNGRITTLEKACERLELAQEQRPSAPQRKGKK